MRFESYCDGTFVDSHAVQIAEMGAYVKLLEYDDIDGMILLSELSRRRIRSIQKLIRVGRNEVVVVLRVDKEKGIFFQWHLCAVTEADKALAKVTSICRSDEYLPRTSSSARSVTTRAKWFTRYYGMSRRRSRFPSRSSIHKSDGL